jgi:CRP-like cAMP-binding protein
MSITGYRNQLIASLTEGEISRLKPELQQVTLLPGDLLHDSGKTFHRAYFPETSIIALTYTTESGSSIEIAGVGFEGIVGLELCMGNGITQNTAVVQTAGLAYLMKGSALKKEFDLAGNFHHQLLRYTHRLMMGIGQTAVCHRHHSIEQQLCGWLLRTLDRLSGLELTMTQEFIANMLGVRREAITEAAGRLQSSGCIRYRRGHIAVLNRAGLESRVCECYAIMKNKQAYLTR